MATASHLSSLGVFPNDGDIKLQSQAAMLVTTSGMVISWDAIAHYSGAT